jgi:hypothetical protein
MIRRGLPYAPPGGGANITHGQIWSSPAGVPGLGGVGREQLLGQLQLDNPHEVQQATLTLGLVNRNPGLTIGMGRIYAKVLFGIGGANNTVLLDWTNQSIVLPVGSCTVTAIQVDSYGAPALDLATGYVLNPLQTIQAELILTACLAAGDRGGQAFPTLTQTLDLAAGVTTPFQVPARAKRVLVGDQRGQLASDVFALTAGSLALNLFRLANASDSAIRTEGVILPGMCDNVQLNSAGGATNITLCWLLDG